MSTNDVEYSGSTLTDITLGTIAGRLSLDSDNNGTETNSATGGLDAGVAGRAVQLLDC